MFRLYRVLIAFVQTEYTKVERFSIILEAAFTTVNQSKFM